MFARQVFIVSTMLKSHHKMLLKGYLLILGLRAYKLTFPVVHLTFVKARMTPTETIPHYIRYDLTRIMTLLLGTIE